MWCFYKRSWHDESTIFLGRWTLYCNFYGRYSLLLFLPHSILVLTSSLFDMNYSRRTTRLSPNVFFLVPIRVSRKYPYTFFDNESAYLGCIEEMENNIGINKFGIHVVRVVLLFMQSTNVYTAGSVSYLSYMPSSSPLAPNRLLPLYPPRISSPLYLWILKPSHTYIAYIIYTLNYFWSFRIFYF